MWWQIWGKRRFPRVRFGVISPELSSLAFPGKALVTDSRVPGRILGHHVFYEEIGAEPYILQTVKEGYR